MPTITLSVSDELKKEMDSFKDVNWSEITRDLLSDKVKRLKFLKEMDELLKNSKLTEEDAIRLGREVNKAVAKRYRELK
jgi:hypothetical protein